MARTIRVVTRMSQLALWQTDYVIDLLKKKFPEYDYEIVKTETKGDKILEKSLSAIGDKGLFTQELEEAMLAGEVDFAVHSLKDMPTVLPEGLILSAVTPRQDHRDAFLSKHGGSIEDLPEGAIVGTSSLRRRAQLLHIRPDLQIKDLRGNVNTRLRKFHEGDYDAIILASAGLDRLGLHDEITVRLETDQFISAVGQGAVVIESLESNKEINDMLAQIHDQATYHTTACERAFMRTLEGGCQVPIGAYAEVQDSRIVIEGFVASLDGKEMIRDRVEMPVEKYRECGIALAEKLLDRGVGQILIDIRKEEG